MSDAITRENTDTVAARAEESILAAFREKLWNPFWEAVERYELISPGDRIAVCVSGGKDSMLLAKLMQMAAREGRIPFEARPLVMDPGYTEANRRKIRENLEKLGLKAAFFETNIFDVAVKQVHSPCYLCAKMRRGHLYAKAREMGCGKIALGHHRNDVIETTVMAMLFGAQAQGMMPKLLSANFPGMEMIRPLYAIREEDIIAWGEANGFEFLRCACRFTENTEHGEGKSARQEVKALLKSLEQRCPGVENKVFESLHSVDFDSFPGWKTDGERHTFTEEEIENSSGERKTMLQ